MNIDPTSLLAFAILLSAICAILGQHHFKRLTTSSVEILAVSGLGLGALLTPGPINRYFFIGVLGYAAYSLFKFHCPETVKTISLAQLVLAILLTLGSTVTEYELPMFAKLFLAMTLVPLIPFHLPFASLVGSSQGSLSGLWMTILLTLGLAELSELQPFLLEGLPVATSLLALGSALYCSFTSLGQSHIRPLLTYATIAQISMLWGLSTVFSTFPQWGIPFGITIALVMNGLLVTYHCVQQRFGNHTIGALPGLASPMPRLGTSLILLISLAMTLPIIPIITGLTTMPMADHQTVSLIIISFIVLSVWMLGSWYFAHVLHLTAFGQARPDIPYQDLKTAEVCSLTLLIAAASYSGLFY